MQNSDSFDFWYAVNNTTVLKLPERRLETFGNTVVNYFLVAELMDEIDKVRIREGRIEAFRPQILTPHNIAESLLEGFGAESEEYVQWLRSNQAELHLLQYGFQIRKQEFNQHVISESLPVVIDQVRTQVKEKNDPMSAMLVGVDEPWEVCLIKLMMEVVQKSASKNFQDLRKDPTGNRHEIEQLFDSAAKNRQEINQLGQRLRDLDLFEQYEDRFFDLVRNAG